MMAKGDSGPANLKILGGLIRHELEANVPQASVKLFQQ
jgi:hypothetical protein